MGYYFSDYVFDTGLSEDEAREQLCNLVIKEMERIKKDKDNLDEEPLWSAFQGILGSDIYG